MSLRRSLRVIHGRWSFSRVSELSRQIQKNEDILSHKRYFRVWMLWVIVALLNRTHFYSIASVSMARGWSFWSFVLVPIWPLGLYGNQAFRWSETLNLKILIHD